MRVFDASCEVSVDARWFLPVDRQQITQGNCLGSNHRSHEKIGLRAMAKVFPFSVLAAADLVIDASYEGGTKGIPQMMFWANLFPAPAIRADSARSAVGMRHVW